MVWLAEHEESINQCDGEAAIYVGTCDVVLRLFSSIVSCFVRLLALARSNISYTGVLGRNVTFAKRAFGLSVKCCVHFYEPRSINMFRLISTKCFRKFLSLHFTWWAPTGLPRVLVASTLFRAEDAKTTRMNLWLPYTTY